MLLCGLCIKGKADGKSVCCGKIAARSGGVNLEQGSNVTDTRSLKVKLFADGADLAGIREMAANPMIKGFTTNPTLMRKAGVADYKSFALQVLGVVRDLPISFEVFDADFTEMEKQALEIASWGKNVNVKIPVTNTRGEFCGPLAERLSRGGVQLNVTAVM